MLLGHEEVASCDICKMFLKGVIYCWIDAILMHLVDPCRRDNCVCEYGFEAWRCNEMFYV